MMGKDLILRYEDYEVQWNEKWNSIREFFFYNYPDIVVALRSMKEQLYVVLVVSYLWGQNYLELYDMCETWNIIRLTNQSFLQGG